MPPYSPPQHRLFEAAANSPSVAKRVGIPQQQASKMASEGVKSSTKAKLSAALRSRT